MPYFNNAATTWPKPEIVYEAVDHCFRTYNSPERTISEEGACSSDLMQTSRHEVAEFFGIDNPTRLVFTPSCTYAMNLAILGLDWEAGDVVIMSGLEHHAVSRPIRKVCRERYVQFEVPPYAKNNPIDLNFVEETLKLGNVKLVACTMASNVSGDIMPSVELGKLAHKYGALYLVDAAQAAGLLSVDVNEIQADMLGFAGHKGLFGPPGVGGLYVREGIQLDTLAEGGTGKDSGKHAMSGTFPSNYEVGTHNLLAIVGMAAGIRWINQSGLNSIRQHEMKLSQHFLERVQNIPGVTIYGADSVEDRTAVVSLTFDDMTPSEVARYLSEKEDIATRPGFHCAPLAHETIGTCPGEGTLRFSFGFSNTIEEIDIALNVLAEMPRGAKV